MVDRAAAIAFQEGFCQAGDRFLVTAGVPLGTPSITISCSSWNTWYYNLLRIAFVSPRWHEGDLIFLRMVLFHTPFK
ncbi:hypothetical protein CEV08_04700 [Bartonella tribocorum]|uniref:Uncharacterized protein n=1 Tax=Bartonella tribocorum TaxID=85701 RepID=A0A2M6UVW5_9HYPH|nr:hypothetical protein CEV08_04700 [Bartonella tribocorum]